MSSNSLFSAAAALEEALAGPSLYPRSVPGQPPSISCPKSCPGTPGRQHSGVGGGSERPGQRGTPGLCPCRAPCHVLSIKPWKCRPGGAQPGGRPALPRSLDVSRALLSPSARCRGAPGAVTGHRARSKALIKRGVRRASAAGAPESGDLSRCRIFSPPQGLLKPKTQEFLRHPCHG